MRRFRTSLSGLALGCLSLSPHVSAFVAVRTPRTPAHTTTTSLSAIPALVKKAKMAALKEYVAQGVPEDVMTVYRDMMQTYKTRNESPQPETDAPTMSPLQEALTRRKGTITVIAEFRRQRDVRDAGPAPDANASDATPTPTPQTSLNLDPEVLSPMFRLSGASAVAVLADERVGGCTYEDLRIIATEQSRARNSVPGPVPVINSDVVLDELQVARSKVAGADAVLVSLTLNGNEQTQKLMQCAQAVGLEVIVGVETAEEAQTAVDLGATMISVMVDGADANEQVITNLVVPEGRRVTTIANIRAYNDKQWLEVEEAWTLRDRGFNCAWVGDALYKSGMDVLETPGAIIKAMKSKSSVKFASPKVYTGKGEGAREYLGDILM